MFIVRILNINLLKRRHRHYSKSGFYGFLTKNVIKVVLILLLVLLAFFVLEKWVIDLVGVFRSFSENLSDLGVFILFAISESLFGLIPPDFFIIWSRKFSSPWVIVSLLALISYFGGIISYFIGIRVRKIRKLNRFIEVKFGDHFKKIKQWGSLFIITAALFPLPYSTVCIISGVLKFPLKVFLIIGVSRILRFYFYALILLGLISLR